MSLLKWLWSNYLRAHWAWTVLAVLLMMIEGSMLGLVSLAMKPMFDEVFIGGDTQAIWTVGGAVMGIFAVRGLTSVAHRVVMSRLSETVGAAMRGDMLARVMRLDSGFHQIHPPGTLIERIQTDVYLAGTACSGLVTGAGRDIIALIWLFGTALWIDWIWTLVALVGIPLMVAPTLIVQRYVRRKARLLRDVAARQTTRLDEVLHGVEAIKLNRLEDYQQAQFDTLSRARIRATVRTVLGQASIPGLVDLMSGLGFMGVLIYGGNEIISGHKTVGEFMTFFTAMALAFDPLRRLGGLSGMWQSALASIERIHAVLSTEVALKAPAAPLPAPKGAPEVRFDDVHLSYGDLPVLRGVSFVAEAGKTTALVGASGAGKSTIFRALTRLVDPTSGEITLSGVPTQRIAVAELRDMMSTVSQEAALFDETLRENILLGRSDVTDAALAPTLDAAHISDFLAQLPEGLSSMAGPRGSALSGGQRQRVAIARALLRDTPVLMLDEATSALDTKSEAIVQAALETLAQGRTTLVIAHRLSTVRKADKILVMDRGRVIDEGTHEALLARQGVYADLHRMQFREDDT